MDNREYLRSIGVTPENENYETCLNVMEGYGSNKWWELPPAVSPERFAYYQTREPVMLCGEFARFHEAVEQLLGRPVMLHEFVGDALQEQVRQAGKRWHFQ